MTTPFEEADIREGEDLRDDAEHLRGWIYTAGDRVPGVLSDWISEFERRRDNLWQRRGIWIDELDPDRLPAEEEE